MASREPAAQVARSRDKDFYAALGRAIRVTRTEQGLERKELARLAGLSYPYLSEIEKGKKRASTEALLPIARALGLRQSELLERAERLLEHGLSRSDLAPTPRRRSRQSRELARVYRLAPARAESAGEAGLQELLSRAGHLAADDFNRVLDLMRRLAR
ncbi:MAG: helix-turn-helix domain-containing protein [Chloroflexi bacterium]|nr:MAG: helix-turn-helix domain-containing protein [Chloroflexota bacterium]